MAMELECPRCRFTPLEAIQAGGVDLDECPKCGGRWYDLGELNKVAKNPEKLEKAFSEGLFRPRAGELVCPHCRETMTNGGLVSELLRVDFCQKCGGFWLDKNEIRLLDELLGAK